jgi:hypothetical protein
LWWFFTENEWGRLWKRWCLLFDAKRGWWWWLRWAYFFDDEWLQNKMIIKEKTNNKYNLRLGVELVVVEESEL